MITSIAFDGFDYHSHDALEYLFFPPFVGCRFSSHTPVGETVLSYVGPRRSMAVYKGMLAAAQGGYAPSASPGLDAEAMRVSAVTRLQVSSSWFGSIDILY